MLNNKTLYIIFIIFINRIFDVSAINNQELIILQKLKIELNRSLPELTVNQINPTDINNIYEVISGHKVFYIEGSGRYIFLGNLVDLKTKNSLTQEKVEKLSAIHLSQLPLNIAFKQVIGKGEKKIVVFVDPDCPFCKRLEEEIILKLNNVTVYYFLFPLSIHADSLIDSKKIICSKNPNKVLLDWLHNSLKELPYKSDCQNVTLLKTMQDVGKKYGIEATPTIILEDGKTIPGLVPLDYFNQLLDNASLKTK